MKKTMSRLGFTLIELLIVITIIGILAVVFLPTVLNAPAKARDATRQADTGSVAEAIAAAGLDGKTLPAASGCVDTKFTVADFGKYFSNGIVPVDPKTDNSGFGTCNTAGKYTFEIYGKGDFKYGVFARLEVAGKGNVACTDIPIKGGAAITAPTLVANSGDCYGALAQ